MILRPAVLVGDEGILINNIAWALRRMPMFGLFGDGEYRLQPIFAKDLAALAVAQVAADTNATLDAIGPETFMFRGLVEEIAAAIDVRTMVVSMPPGLALATVSLMSKFVGDQIVTRRGNAGHDGRTVMHSIAAGRPPAPERLAAGEPRHPRPGVHERKRAKEDVARRRIPHLSCRGISRVNHFRPFSADTIHTAPIGAGRISRMVESKISRFWRRR